VLVATYVFRREYLGTAILALATVTKPAGSTRRAYVEGPIVSEVGLVLAVVEYLASRREA